MLKSNLIFIFSLAFNFSISQINDFQRSIDLKENNLLKKDDSQSLLKLSPVKGLTDSNVKITMGIPPIEGYKEKESGITNKRDVVDPSWEISQKFSENQKDISKYSRD